MATFASAWTASTWSRSRESHERLQHLGLRLQVVGIVHDLHALDAGRRRRYSSGMAVRRFEATAGMNGRPWVWMYGGIAIVGGLIAAAKALLIDAVASVVVPAVIILSLIAWLVWVISLFRPRRVLLELGDAALRVDEGRGSSGTFQLAGARLGLWRTPGVGVTAGTVLHLADATAGKKHFRLAGRDHRAGPAHRLDAEPVEQIDAMLSSAAFDELLAALPAWVFSDRPRPRGPGPLGISLAPNPSSLRYVLGTMLPWLSTIALVGVLGGVLDAAGVLDTRLGASSRRGSARAW
jgi:hypothetical protein